MSQRNLLVALIGIGIVAMLWNIEATTKEILLLVIGVVLGGIVVFLYVAEE